MICRVRRPLYVAKYKSDGSQDDSQHRVVLRTTPAMGGLARMAANGSVKCSLDQPRVQTTHDFHRLRVPPATPVAVIIVVACLVLIFSR